MTKFKLERQKIMFKVNGATVDRAGLLAACPWILRLPSPFKKVTVGMFPGDEIKDFPQVHRCEGMCHGRLPMYAHYKTSKEGKGDEEYDAKIQAKREAALEKGRCKKNARFVYAYQNGTVEKLCMDHVMSRALMAGCYSVEDDRFNEWFKANAERIR